MMTLNKYLEVLSPHVAELAKVKERAHPFLGRDDLHQEGLIALWETWERHREKPFEELKRIGFKSAWYRMVTVYRTTIKLLPYIPEEKRGYNDDGEFWFMCLDFRRYLTDTARRVFDEMLNPSDQTLQSFETLRRWSEIYACNLRLTEYAVKKSVREIKTKAERYLMR